VRARSIVMLLRAPSRSSSVRAPRRACRSAARKLRRRRDKRSTTASTLARKRFSYSATDASTDSPLVRLARASTQQPGDTA